MLAATANRPWKYRLGRRNVHRGVGPSTELGQQHPLDPGLSGDVNEVALLLPPPFRGRYVQVSAAAPAGR